jgi:trans-aconitate methyltransferase
MALASNSNSASWSERQYELAAAETGSPQADLVPQQALIVQNYAYMLDACGQISGKRVLDAGFGNGDLARILDRMGGDVTAFDMVSTQICQLREEAPTIAWWQGDISTWKQPRHADPFDLVVACETLQFVEFNSAVHRFMHVTSDGGRIVILIPNADCPIVQSASQEFENKYIGVSMKSLGDRLASLAIKNYVAYRGIYLQHDASIAPYRCGTWRQISPRKSSIPTPHVWENRTAIPHRLQVVIIRSQAG